MQELNDTFQVLMYGCCATCPCCLGILFALNFEEWDFSLPWVFFSPFKWSETFILTFPHWCQLPLRLSVACTETLHIAGVILLWSRITPVILQWSRICSLLPLAMSWWDSLWMWCLYHRTLVSCCWMLQQYLSEKSHKEMPVDLDLLCVCLYKVFLLQIIILHKAEYYLTVRSVLNP